jgi:hypothetical protein
LCSGLLILGVRERWRWGQVALWRNTRRFTLGCATLKARTRTVQCVRVSRRGRLLLGCTGRSQVVLLMRIMFRCLRVPSASSGWGQWRKPGDTTTTRKSRRSTSPGCGGEGVKLFRGWLAGLRFMHYSSALWMCAVLITSAGDCGDAWTNLSLHLSSPLFETAWPAPQEPLLFNLRFYSKNAEWNATLWTRNGLVDGKWLGEWALKIRLVWSIGPQNFAWNRILCTTLFRRVRTRRWIWRLNLHSAVILCKYLCDTSAISKRILGRATGLTAY